MKLKDKFDNPIMRHDLGRNEIEETKEQCVEIAEDFAIGFAEWSSFYRDKNRNYKLDMLHAKSKYDESYTTKELLEIYKKEKGL